MTEVEQPPVYIHLPAGAEPPTIAPQPCRIVVIIEQDVTTEWQAQISKWIIDVGCLFMIAWGRNCSSWDDSVDIANLADHNWGVIPDSQFVMTTWHDDEPLKEAMWFCRFAARHSEVALPNVIVVHIGETAQREEILAAYRKELDEE